MEAAMNPKVIVIDGKTYHGVEEMPPDVRQKYEQALQALADSNGNHIPDALENILIDKDNNGVPDLLENLGVGTHVTSHVKVTVNGKEFNGIEDLPPEARARYEAALSKLDANKNGIPDFVEGMMGTADQNQVAPASNPFTAANPPRSEPIPVSPTITPDTSNGLTLALVGLFFLLLCIAGAGAAWYFFLR
jgi:hypothetical protein